MFGWYVPEVQPGLPWWPLAVLLALMVIFNVVSNRVAPPAHYLSWALGASVLFIAVGLLDGASFTDMGLGWGTLLPGVVWAAVSIGGVALVYAIGSSFRKTRSAFHDERMQRLTGSRMAFQALIEVPFGTVLVEEIAFRAVLFAMLARRFGFVWALVISALLFGLWHILPSIGTHESNPALGSVVGSGRRGQVLAVLGSVLATSVAGVVFTMMRVVSGSVLAPMGLHWATNGWGYAFSWVMIRMRRKRQK